MTALAGTLDEVYFEARWGETEGWRVITVVGEVDLATLPEFRSAVTAAAAGSLGSSVGLAIDLTHCGFIDSLGLGATLGGLRRMRAVGGRFAVICPDERVRSIFVRCRLDEIIEIHPSLSSATSVDPTPSVAG